MNNLLPGLWESHASLPLSSKHISGTVLPGMLLSLTFWHSIKSCCQNQISGQGKHCKLQVSLSHHYHHPCIFDRTKILPGSVAWARVYDDVPYEKMQVWSLGTLGNMAKARLLALPLSFLTIPLPQRNHFCCSTWKEGEGTFLPQTVAGENVWNRRLGSVEEKAPHQEEREGSASYRALLQSEQAWAFHPCYSSVNRFSSCLRWMITE